VTRRDFSTRGIHPRTLSGVKPGSKVIVRDSLGRLTERVAVTAVIRGADFPVVLVCWPGEWDAATRLARDPDDDAVPWPAEDVWLPGDEPKDGPDHG
jgi:hypothetical protein